MMGGFFDDVDMGVERQVEVVEHDPPQPNGRHRAIDPIESALEALVDAGRSKPRRRLPA